MESKPKEPVVVDTHFHLWDLKKFPYSFPTPDLPVIYKNHLIDDYRREFEDSPITHSIFMQVEPPYAVEEAEWVMSLGKDFSPLTGLVAGFPLDHANFKQIIDRFSEEKLFLGVRNIVEYREKDWLLTDDAMRGFSYLAEKKIPYHILINSPTSRDNFLSLLKQYPNHPFTVDHMGKPVIGLEHQHGWDDWITEVSKYPNVVCKLSSQLFPSSTKLSDAQLQGNFSSDDRKYVNRCLELFGVDRCLYGSDFPVFKIHGIPTIKAFYNVLDGILNHLTQEERNKIFGGNSVRFYGLDV